jgi:hypothetical protein
MMRAGARCADEQSSFSDAQMRGRVFSSQLFATREGDDE